MKLQVVLLILWLAEFNCHRPESHEHNLHSFYEAFYWDEVDFKLPNATARKDALNSRSYIPKNNVIEGIGVWEDKVFVSIFRYRTGVASSFNYFHLNSDSKSPVLHPYPSFDENYINENPLEKTLALQSSSSIVCAASFKIDKCDRIWIMDAGFVDFTGQRRVISAPAIVIFDLKTNKLIRRYVVPAAFVNENTFYTNLDVDLASHSCNDVYAYAIDMFRSILVYSFNEDRSWQVTHSLFGSNPRSTNFNYEGLNFQWNYGITGLTVGEHHRDGSRRVYISPLSSTKSFYISNKVLQNEAYIAANNYYNDVHCLGDRGSKGQIFKWAYDNKKNVLFDTQFQRGRIGCWNTMNPYRNTSFGVVYKNKNLFFPADIDIDRDRNVWVLSNRLPVFLYSHFNKHTKNMRIFKQKVDEAIEHTVCEFKP